MWTPRRRKEEEEKSLRGYFPQQWTARLQSNERWGIMTKYMILNHTALRFLQADSFSSVQE